MAYVVWGQRPKGNNHSRDKQSILVQIYNPSRTEIGLEDHKSKATQSHIVRSVSKDKCKQKNNKTYSFLCCIQETTSTQKLLNIKKNVHPQL